jgi:hypothetical protein
LAKIGAIPKNLFGAGNNNNPNMTVSNDDISLATVVPKKQLNFYTNMNPKK